MKWKKAAKRLGAFGAVILATALVWTWWGRSQQQAAFSTCRMPGEVLVIDPGHGGEDGGAVSATGQPESQINLAIGLRLDALMGFYGVETVMTRTEDVSIYDSNASTLREKKVSDIHNRVALVESLTNPTLISIHQNSFPETRYHGTQVFFVNESLSLPLAQGVQNLIKEAIDPHNNRTPLKIPSSVYLMNHISCRAILVECGFLSNPEEEEQLRDADYQKKLAMTLGAAYLTSQQGETPLGEVPIT